MADINGTNSSETLRGTPLDDKILTYAGEDIVFAGDGNDQINGTVLGDGTLSFYEFNGNKTIYGEGGNDVLIGGVGNDILDGGAGNDIIISRGGSDTIKGGDGNDWVNSYVYSNGRVGFYRYSGSVNVDGGSGDDVIYGTSGDDTIDGGAGADKMYGGPGNDYYVVDTLADYVWDDEGTNTGLIKVDFYKQPTGVTWKLADGVKPLPYWVDALVGSDSTYIDAQKSLAAGVIKYAFPDAALSSWSSDDKLGFTPLNAAQRAFVEKCLEYVSTIINIKFEKVSDASQPGVLTFANNQQSGNEAGYATGGLSQQKWAVFFSNTGSIGLANADPRDGQSSALTFIHEIGHALGLKHPHNQTVNNLGVSDPPYLSAQEDVTTFTQMSYTEQAADFVSKFRDLDIAALQYLYGPANIPGTAPHQAGDNVYTISPDQRNFIWDGGGKDTLNASAANSPLVLYLQPGSQGYFGSTISKYITSAGQITINFGTTIENALGTPFDDKIYGNEVANYLGGGAGNDALFGLGGNDQLSGGPGADTLDGGEGFDAAYYNGEGFSSGIIVDLEAGTATGGAGNDRLISIEAVWGTEKDDKFYGSKGNDFFVGDAGNDYADGRDGYDTWQINSDFSTCTFSLEGDVCVITTKDLGTDRLLNIEQVIFVGTSEVKKTIEQLKAIVASGNRSPAFSASAQTLTVTEDLPKSISIGATDPDGDALSYSISSAPSKGTATIAGTTVTYSPNLNYNGQDTFIVTVTDGKGGSATQTINVTVTPVIAETGSIDVGTAANAVIVDASKDLGGNSPADWLFTDDTAKGTNVVIVNFSKGDLISVTGKSTDYTFTTLGADLVISSVNTGSGVSNKITLQNIAPGGFVNDEASAEDVLGYNFFNAATSSVGTGAKDPSGLLSGNLDADDDGNLLTSSLVNASTKSLNFTEDANVANNVRISGFGKDDLISVSNAQASDYTFQGVGTDIVISLNKSGIVSTIVLAASKAADFSVKSYDDAKLAIGAEFFRNALIAPPVSAFRLVSPDGWSGAVGGNGTIVGTSGYQDIRLVSGAVTLDGSFNLGGDVIRLDGAGSGYSIVRSGSSATLAKGTSLSVSLPIGTAGLPVVFDDGPRKLIYLNGSFNFGSQSFSTTTSMIVSGSDGTPLPSGGIASANASVVLAGTPLAAGQVAHVALSGNASVIGTSAKDVVQVLSVSKTSLSFDPSFNQGGDIIIIGRDAASFTAQRSSSSMVLTSSNETLTIPIGTVGLTLRFNDGDRTLIYSNGEFKLGAQAIGASVVQLSASTASTSLDTGTAASPVTISASNGAFNFTDNAARETNVKITGFGPDDRITVTGATSSQYSFTTINTDGNGTADLVINFNNTGASVVNSITLIEAVSANAFVSNFATAQLAMGNPNFMVFG